MKLSIFAFVIILGSSIYFSLGFQKKNKPNQLLKELKNEPRQFLAELSRENIVPGGVITMNDMILAVSLDDPNDDFVGSITILSMDGSKIKTIKKEQGDLDGVDVSFLKPGKYEVIAISSDGHQDNKHIEIKK